VGRGRHRRPWPWWRGSSAGFTLLEILFVTVLLCILMAIAIPQMLTGIDRSRGLAAARYLASRMALARAQAAGRSAIVALWFQQESRGVTFGIVQDGNRNGVRTKDIQLQIDRLIEAPVVLSDLFPGVDIGLAPQTPGADAVQLGGSNLLSFSPAGTSSSGTVYVRGRDGTQWAVRVLGATARARVLRYVPLTREWVYAS
jgi:prepilin-type N-terminal cleavage/methylation domain-containing protein